jgi:hypothetical protein
VLLFGSKIGARLAILRHTKELSAKHPIQTLATASGREKWRENMLTKTPDMPKPISAMVTVR